VLQELFRKLFNDVQNIHEELAEYINIPSWNRPAFSNYDDDDEDYTIAITPKEPDNSLNNSLPEFETFSNHTKETNSGSTTTHANYSLPKYDSFLFEIKPDQGELTSVVMKDNLAEPQVHVPNVLTTHPTLMLDSDFIPSDNSLPESKISYFDIEEKNSGSTTIHADISLLDLECFNFKREPYPGELTSIVDFRIVRTFFLQQM
nr:hypothetical protein [Tanacetum cinerariifolium]